MAASQIKVYPHDAISFYAKNILDNYLDEKGPIVIPDHMKPHFDSFRDGSTKLGDVVKKPPFIPIYTQKIAIIGAGVGGLYAGLILKSLGIPFDIIELDNRVGGRLKTHYFSDEENDYFNVGATRFPDTLIMNRVFELFNYLGMSKEKQLFPYIYKCPTAILHFNDISKPQDPTQILTASTFAFPHIPSPYAGMGVDALIDYTLKPFADALRNDMENGGRKGWKLLMRYDADSARSYMTHGPTSDDQDLLNPDGLLPYPLLVINWLETVDTSTGAFDRALSEAVIDALIHTPDTPDTPVDSYAITGGTQTLADIMYQNLDPDSVSMNTRVTKLSLLPFYWDRNFSPTVQVETRASNGDVGSNFYDHAILTTTLPNLRVMDLSDAWLTNSQTMALRELEYGPALKVGVKFKTAWWEGGDYQPQFGPIKGGMSFTDRVASMVVYPSYESTVLICAYGWTKGALQLIPLIAEDNDECKETLKDLICRDLVAIHGLDPVDGYDFLREQWLDSWCWSWTKAAITTGAYGYFGPGQYKKVYPSLKSAAWGRIHFAGEGVSERHSWTVGALDASWRAIYQILVTSYPDLVLPFKLKWGMNEGWTEKDIFKLLAVWEDENNRESPNKTPQKKIPRPDGRGQRSGQTPQRPKGYTGS